MMPIAFFGSRIERSLRWSVLLLAGILALLMVNGGEAAIVSVRSAERNGGTRIVVDLDSPSSYIVRRSGDEIEVRMKTKALKRIWESLPKGHVVSLFKTESVKDDTLLRIRLRKTSVVYRHFSLKNPDRIVIDVLPRRVSVAKKATLESGQKTSIDLLTLHELSPGSSPKRGDVRSMVVPLFDRDMSVRNIFATTSGYFDISPAWKLLDGSYVEIDLSHSQTTDSRFSNVTVEINEVPLYTIRLNEKNEWNGRVRIPLPYGYLRPGSNEIVLKNFMRATDVPCHDIDNPGNWLNIYANSYVSLNYVYREQLCLRDFPSPYFERNALQGQECAIVIPDGAGPEIVEAAYSIIMNWAAEAPFRQFRPSVLRMSEVTEVEARSRHMIYLGTRSDLFPEILKAFATPEPLIGKCFLSSFVNSRGRGRLLLTAEDSPGVCFAVRALLNEGLRRQMQGHRQLLSLETPIPKGEEGIAGPGMSFADLQVGDVVFRGTYNHEFPFSFRIPPQWKLRGSPSMTLNFHHSPALKEERSILTVDVNGAPQTAVVLGPSNVQDGRLTVKLPNELKGGDYYTFILRAYLDIDTFDCSHNYTEGAWLVVDGNSFLNIPHDDEKMSPLLESLPYIFDGNVTVFLGRTVDGRALTALGKLLLRWGQLLPGSMDVKVRSLDDLNGEVSGGAVILASLDELEARKLSVAIGFDSKTGRAISGEKMSVLPEFASRAALFQLRQKDHSPVLTISWVREMPDGDGFDNVLLRDGLRGDTCLVSSSGEMASFFLEAEDIEVNKDRKTSWYERFLDRFRGDRIALAVFAVLCTLVIFLQFFVFFRLRRR